MRTLGQKGVTFIELLIVISILSVFALMAFPAMRGPHEKNKLRAAAREVIALTRYARAAAVLNSVEVLLEFDLPKSRMRVDLGKMATRNKKSRVKQKDRLEREVEIWRDLPKNIFFLAVFSWEEMDKKGEIARIRFYADGSASDSCVVLANTQEKHMTVSIGRATGQAEVFTGLPENWDEIK